MDYGREPQTGIHLEHSSEHLLEETVQVAKELGEDLSEEDLDEMIKEASKDAEGRVAEADFFAIMKRTCLY